MNAQTVTLLMQAIDRCSPVERAKVAAAFYILAVRAGQLSDTATTGEKSKQFDRVRQVLDSLAIRAEVI